VVRGARCCIEHVASHCPRGRPDRAEVPPELLAEARARSARHDEGIILYNIARLYVRRSDPAVAIDWFNRRASSAPKGRARHCLQRRKIGAAAGPRPPATATCLQRASRCSRAWALTGPGYAREHRRGLTSKAVEA
jgi:hypothetical protein